jgi:hypothetical protein
MFDEIAYSNCLPWRTASESGFEDCVARSAVELYVQPLIEELKPAAIVAMGKRAASILALAEYSPKKNYYLESRTSCNRGSTA